LLVWIKRHYRLCSNWLAEGRRVCEKGPETGTVDPVVPGGYRAFVCAELRQRRTD
jgi:hypothetical protein